MKECILITTMIVVGAAVMACPMVLEYLSATNSQNTIANFARGYSGFSVELDHYEVEGAIKNAFLFAGAILSGIGCLMAWRNMFGRQMKGEQFEKRIR